MVKNQKDDDHFVEEQVFDTCRIFLPEGKTMKGKYCVSVLKRVLKRLSRMRQRFGEEDSCFICMSILKIAVKEEDFRTSETSRRTYPPN